MKKIQPEPSEEPATQDAIARNGRSGFDGFEEEKKLPGFLSFPLSKLLILKRRSRFLKSRNEVELGNVS